MRVRSEHILVPLSTFAAIPKTRAQCSWQSDCFASPKGELYSVGQCGYDYFHTLSNMRGAFERHCNATAVGYHDSQYWHLISEWYPVILNSRTDDPNDTVFINCIKVAHASDAPEHIGAAAAAVLVSAFVFAYALC